MIERFLVVVSIFFVFGTTQGFAQYAADQPFEVTDSSQAIANRIVSSEIPVVVDFWAAWCRPCLMLNPIIEELEKRYHKKALFIKVNIDIHKELSAYFSITSIPMVFMIYQKNVVKAIAGVQPKEVYEQALDAIITQAHTIPAEQRPTAPDTL